LPPETPPEKAVEAYAIFEGLPGSEAISTMEISKVAGEAGYIDLERP
jgi:hypothetical protein